MKYLLPALLFALVASPTHAERVLDREKAERLEIRHSMIGFRNTLLFYTFPDQAAVLKLSIANTDESFPVTGTVYLFEEGATAEGLKKWLNNQHSDGLYVDPAQPKAVHTLPKGVCKVTAFKATGTSQNPGGRLPGRGTGVFRNYEVTVTIKDHALPESFKLKAFTDTTQVHVEVKDI